jgi:hypothetical protein
VERRIFKKNKKTTKKQWSKGACVAPYNVVGPKKMKQIMAPRFKSST